MIVRRGSGGEKHVQRKVGEREWLAPARRLPVGNHHDLARTKSGGAREKRRAQRGGAEIARAAE